jgi:hypothetical protein
MKQAFHFLSLALYAFLGLGLEVALIGLEPNIYGVPLSEWTKRESCFHWILTCIVWGIMCFVLITIAKKKYNFDVFAKKLPINRISWIISIGIVCMGILGVSFMWNGFKPTKEFAAHGLIPFIFQYFYYLVEMVLVMLIISFGQQFGELVSKKRWIPWGGIVLSCTWGLVHILTQDMQTGIFTVILSLVFGVLYLFMKKNIVWAYLFIGCIFIL